MRLLLFFSGCWPLPCSPYSGVFAEPSQPGAAAQGARRLCVKRRRRRRARPDTGETVSINGNTAFPMASTVKVAVAAAYLSQVDHGRRSLDDKISGQSAASLMERMMIHSDNHATDILIRDLGGPPRDPGLGQLQRPQQSSRRPQHRGTARRKRDLWDVRDSSTPLAMIDLLRRLDKGKVLSTREPRPFDGT